MRLQPIYNFFKSRKNNTSSFHSDTTAVPQSFIQMEMTQFMALIRNLDPNCTGSVNYRQLLSYFILLCSEVPSERQLDAFNLIANEKGLIDKETFVGATFWFEQTEDSQDRPQHEVFERKRFVKESLFDANAKPVDGEEGLYVRAADIIAIMKQPATRGKFKEFKDFLFAPVDKVNV